jgi:hypothetical protein
VEEVMRARLFWLLALLLAVAVLAGGCSAIDFLNEIEEPGLDITRMETDLRSQLQHDLESRSRSTRSSVASVGRVRCRERSEVEATCFARVPRRGGRRLRELAVFVDPDTGRYRWEYVR